MKKLFSSISSALGIAPKEAPTPIQPTAIFEQVVISSKASGDYMPAWECFVNTEFFVPVIRSDVGKQTKDFRFVVQNNPQDKKPYVIVSEELGRLENPHSAEAIKIKGAALIEQLNPEVGILVSLSNGGFGMPADLVAWLRASIQPAH